MGITDLFSKRQRRSRGEVPDVFQYELLPLPFRVQVVYIILDLFTPADAGAGYSSMPQEALWRIHGTLCSEYGVITLSDEKDSGANASASWVPAFGGFAGTAPTEKVLDLIEVALQEEARLRRDGHFTYKR